MAGEREQALAEYLANDPETKHKADYFRAGYNDAVGGYFDTWYNDKKAYDAYLKGSYAGRKHSSQGLTVIESN